MKSPPKPSKRKTSKLWLAVNTGLAWGAIFYAIWTQQGAVVVGSLVGLIGTLYGAYVGVGHWDFKRLLESASGGYPPPPPPMAGHQYDPPNPDDYPG